MHNHIATKNAAPIENVYFGQLLIYRMIFLLQTNDVYFQNMCMMNIRTIRALIELHFYSDQKGIILFHIRV